MFYCYFQMQIQYLLVILADGNPLTKIKAIIDLNIWSNWAVFWSKQHNIWSKQYNFWSKFASFGVNFAPGSRSKKILYNVQNKNTKC